MAHEQIVAAFPRRSLTLSRARRGVFGIIFALIGALGFGAFAVGIAVNYVPDLITDMAVARDPVEVPGNAGYNCSIHRGFISTCTVEIRYQGEDKRQHYRETALLFLGRLDRDQPLSIRHARGSPDRVSTSWGESYLTDRWLTLAGAVALFAALAIGCALGAVNQQRGNAQRRALAAKPNPTPVTLQSVVKAKGQNTWTFAWNAGAQTFTATDVLRGKRTPLLLDATGTAGLALSDAGGRAILLDDRLSDVSLTEPERQAVFQAIAGSAPGHAATAAPIVQR